MATNKTIIFHNPRCSKSRAALNYLEEQHCDIEVVDYLHGVTEAKLTEVIQELGIKPEELIRKNEAIFKEKYANKNFSDAEWIKIMVENPILIERPIVIQDGKAVIGRPTQRVIDLVKHQ